MKKTGIVFLMLLALCGFGLHVNAGDAFAWKKDAVTEESANQAVNINTAKIEDLIVLKGIGPSLAARIIKYREANGDFKSIDDLLSVRGIGAGKFAKFKAQVCV